MSLLSKATRSLLLLQPLPIRDVGEDTECSDERLVRVRNDDCLAKTPCAVGLWKKKRARISIDGEGHKETQLGTDPLPLPPVPDVLPDEELLVNEAKVIDVVRVNALEPEGEVLVARVTVWKGTKSSSVSALSALSSRQLFTHSGCTKRR